MYRKKNAFTLIEAILTVAVIGILAAVILPRFITGGLFQGPVLRSATSQITADIRYTRRLAVTNSGHYLIKFDFNLNEYRIYKDSVAEANQVGLAKNVRQGISLSGSEQFDFYPLGNAFFNGNGLDVFTDQTHQYRILVEPPSGAASIEKLF